MLNKEEIIRYNRHLLLPEIGTAGQEKIKSSRVLVIGAGGLGCPALLYLTAMGVGDIGIVDFDRIEESNLQRQILYTTNDVGKFKAEVAASHLSARNPFIKITPYNFHLHNRNAIDLFSKYDLIVDGTDNFTTRYLVNDACVLLDKPLVYGAIHKFEGQVSVLNYKGSSSQLSPTYRCLFPTPPPQASVQNCSEAGVLGILPGIIGMIQATEAIKIIAAIGEPLAGKLMMFNALQMDFSVIQISRDDEWLDLVPKNRKEFEKMNYEGYCGSAPAEVPVKAVTVSELKQLVKNNVTPFILDVRSYGEEPRLEGLGNLQIPLSDIRLHTGLIPKKDKVVVICKSGIRSKRAIQILENDFGFTNLYNLEGGAMEWLKEAKPESLKY